MVVGLRRYRHGWHLQLDLGPGDWRIGYEILSDSDSSRNLLRHSSPTKVTAVSGSTVTQDFTIKTAGATITGGINDENGAQLSDQTVYVWACTVLEMRPTMSSKPRLSPTDGTFTLKVEAGGQYKVGAFISPQLRELAT